MLNQKPIVMRNILVTVEFPAQLYKLMNKANNIADEFVSNIWLLYVAASAPYFVAMLLVQLTFDSQGLLN